jgi:hypothetical protein
MLSLDDERWARLMGGYRTPVDVRPLLRNLESSIDSQAAWDSLWNELHHQGDVGEASYAAVPHLVRNHRERGLLDWNTYAMVAAIELLRGRDGNPEVPSWLMPGYETAIADLARMGLEQLPDASSPEEVRSILAVLATWKGVRTYARILSDFTEDELLELVAQAFGEDAG